MKNTAGVAVFYGTFVFLSIFLLALIGGLVWEVFTIIDKRVDMEELEEVVKLEVDDSDPSEFLNKDSMEEEEDAPKHKSYERKKGLTIVE